MLYDFFRALSFVYPYGATLNIMKPSTAVLSSGSVSFPLNRPVCAFYQSVSRKEGYLLCRFLDQDFMNGCLMFSSPRTVVNLWSVAQLTCSQTSMSIRKKMERFS